MGFAFRPENWSELLILAIVSRLSKNENTYIMNEPNKKGDWFIGTSGWQYKHWKKLFYPEELKTSSWLNFYCRNFDIVELNSSFYHQPSKDVFAGWAAAVPPQFVFAVKAPSFFTHLKKLSDPGSQLKAFIESAGALGPHLGPILFQLPPRWHLNIERFETFVDKLPDGLKVTVEFRDPTWHRPELFDLLEKKNIAFCIYELGGYQSPVISTASFIYIRLHGPGQKYEGSYPDYRIRNWAIQVKNWTELGKDVYVFFDNDQFAYAPHNALDLLKRLNDL